MTPKGRAARPQRLGMGGQVDGATEQKRVGELEDRDGNVGAGEDGGRAQIFTKEADRG